MNIYYFNVEHIISSYWRYLIEVLKVSHVFSFINPSQMDEESKTQLSPYLRLYKTNEETKEFCSKCVYKIANIIYATIEEQKTKDGAEAYKDSKFYAPRDNLRNTMDKNILVIGKGDRSGEHIFEDVIEWKTWEQRIDIGGYYDDEEEYHEGPYETIYHEIPIDAAQEIARHLINLMNTQGRSGYEDKICHIKWDSYSNFKEAEWIYLARTKEWYQYRCKLTNGTFKYGVFVSYINHSLMETYPDVFPILEGENRKKKYTVFWNREMRNKDIKKAKDIVAEEQRMRYIELQERAKDIEAKREERFREEQERRDFWDELGESSVNIIDC